VFICRRVLPGLILAVVLCSSGPALGLQGEGGAQQDGAQHTGAAVAVAPLDPANDTSDDFFHSPRVHTFELTIDPSDFARMPAANGHGGRGVGGWQGAHARGSGYARVPAQLRFDGQDWGAITVRYKGNSSYRGAATDLKRSLKLYFSGDGQHRRFFGMTRLNLNNNAFDSSQMRETLAYDVFHEAGVPAPRTAYARVFISVPGEHEREYAGLFTVVEQIDQTFFEQRWGHKVGVLLKPEGLRGLPDLGNDWSSYASSYSAKVRAKPRDARRMISFVQFIDHASDQDFAAHIADYLDVDEFLRFLAVETVIVNSDSPLAMNHNYYLTIRPDGGRIEWVPWDMNMAFGGFRHGEVDLSIYHPSAPGMFPLADRVLADPALLERYKQIVRDLLRQDVTRVRLDAEMRRLESSIRSAAVLDPSGGALQFEANFRERAPRGPQVAGRPRDECGGFAFRERNGPPLRRFIHERIASVREQLAGRRSGVPGRAGFGFAPVPER
jgi:spore coat protein H